MSYEDSISCLQRLKASIDTEVEAWGKQQSVAHNQDRIKTAIREFGVFVDEKRSSFDTFRENFEVLTDKLEGAAEDNGSLFEPVLSLITDFSDLVDEFSNTITDVHVPDFNIDMSPIQDGLENAIEEIESQQEQLISTLTDSAQETFDSISDNMTEGANLIDSHLVEFKEKLLEKSAQSLGLIQEKISEYSVSANEGSNGISSNSEDIKNQIQEKLNETMSGLTEKVSGLSDDIEMLSNGMNETKENFLQMQQLVQQLMDASSTGMTAGSSCLNVATNSLTAVA